MRVTVNKKTVVADINGAGTSGRVDIIGPAVACAVVRYWPAAHDEHVAVPGRHGKRELAREQRKREREVHEQIKERTCNRSRGMLPAPAPAPAATAAS